ncbi:phosphoribosylformylglycinamidine synthase subunit PurS [Corynebacterium kroppenstedtii]|uniref:phosphoribosylformylglycinamidine synthase subunit PurS n=1 Tax=Corynebacterium sp. PCR 32 TaxID=3351342 RepID=UPI00309E0D60
MARVVVNVMPKTEILDPQGQAVLRALGRIGVKGVHDVRQGKRFVLDVDGSVSDEELDRLASTLLANTVIEDYDVVVEHADDTANGTIAAGEGDR